MNYYIGDYPPNEFNTPQGWICPKCGRVYNPTTPMCPYCGGNSEPSTITTDHTILNDKNWWDTYLKQISADNVGGSDYWDNISKEWKNIIENQSNITSNISFLDWYINRDNYEENNNDL